MSEANGAQWTIALLTAMEAEEYADFSRLLRETTVDGITALAACALVGVRTAATIHGVSTAEMIQDGGLFFAEWAEENE